MADLKYLKHCIDPDIDRIEKTMREDIDSLSRDMDDLLLEILNYGLFGGGKRFRPLLAVIAGRLCNGEENGEENEIFKLAIAFEYLHMATLFHDDVIDRAETRRGKPSVNNSYGIAPAILAGDFLHARSMAIVGRYGGSEALEIFCGATGSMVDGEFLQLRNATNFNQSEKDYFDAIHGKTASLIAATTEIGGLHGGAGNREKEALKEYGRNLGCAFQIVDDLLDYIGDEQKTGKIVGNDLAEGKMSLPLIVTMESADSKERGRLLEILNDQELRHRSFDEVVDIIERCDGFSQTRLKAEQCVREGVRQLNIFPQEKEQEVQILTALAEYVMVRKK